ncbi:MAG: hypothetical protein HYX71_08405 [Opitutae bacterium]|nr:hypothetical protein [Opitutae bacterium]
MPDLHAAIFALPPLSWGTSEKLPCFLERIFAAAGEIHLSQQATFLSLGCLTKRTRADRFLDEMSRVVPWAELAAMVAPHYQPAGP